MSEKVGNWRRSAIRNNLAAYRRAQEQYCINNKPFVELEDGSKAFSLISPPLDSSVARRRVRRVVKAITADEAEHQPGKVAGDGRVPHVITIAVTYQCQCDCLHCSASKYRDQVTQEGTALTPAELRSAVDQAVEMGTTCAVFTGGEPLLLDGIYELIEAVDKSKCVCTMFSNGEFLTAENVKKLKAAGLFGVYLSIDDADPARHDENRRRPGMFAKGVEGLKRCQDAGILTGISTYATKENTHDGRLAALMDLAKSLNVLEVFLFDLIPTGQLDGQHEHILSDEDIRVLAEFRNRYNAAPDYPLIIHQTMFMAVGYPCTAGGCPAGITYVHLRANGDVSPCDFTPCSFGNIRDKPLEDIWQEMAQSSLFESVSTRCRLSRPDYWDSLAEIETH